MRIIKKEQEMKSIQNKTDEHTKLDKPYGSNDP
jgi:hypothetical protein